MNSDNKSKRKLDDRKQEIRDKWEAKKQKMMEDRRLERERLKKAKEGLEDKENSKDPKEVWENDEI